MKTHAYLKWSDEGDSALVFRKDSDLEGIARLDALQDWIGMLQGQYEMELDAQFAKSRRNRKAINSAAVS